MTELKGEFLRGKIWLWNLVASNVIKIYDLFLKKILLLLKVGLAVSLVFQLYATYLTTKTFSYEDNPEEFFFRKSDELHNSTLSQKV